MSDSDRSPFEGFTEAEVRHIPPTQADDDATVVVSPVESTGSGSHVRTPLSLTRAGQAGFSARDRDRSVASTPARRSRSQSRASGLADQIRQILRAELRRGTDRRRRSLSSSRGSSDSSSSPQTDGSQSDVRCRSRSCDRSTSGRSCRSHARCSHSFRRSECSRDCSRSSRRRGHTPDWAVSRGPPRLVHAVPRPRLSCTVSVAPATPPGAVQAMSFSAPVLPLFPFASSSVAVASPPRTSPRVLVPLSEAPPPSLPPTRAAPTWMGSSSPQGESGASAAVTAPPLLLPRLGQG